MASPAHHSPTTWYGAYDKWALSNGKQPTPASRPALYAGMLAHLAVDALRPDLP